MPDRWERTYKLNPARNDDKLDADKDGLVNLAEYKAKTNPRKADSDRDQMPDGWEVTYRFNPRSRLTRAFRRMLRPFCRSSVVLTRTHCPS